MNHQRREGARRFFVSWSTSCTLVTLVVHALVVQAFADTISIDW